jgi:hypothetical protein
MKQALVKKYKDKVSKLATLNRKLSGIVEVNNKIQRMEERQCQRMSEARGSQATVVTVLVEQKVLKRD